MRVKYRDASLTEDKIQAMSRAANLDSDRYKTYPPFDKNFNVWPSFTAL